MSIWAILFVVVVVVPYAAWRMKMADDAADEIDERRERKKREREREQYLRSEELRNQDHPGRP